MFAHSFGVVALTINQHVANNGQFPYADRNDDLKSVGGKDLLDDEFVTILEGIA
jgi:hypothetical protein